METKVLEQEEIQAIKDLKVKREQLMADFGFIEIRIQELTLQKENLTYKTFMHTWKMKDGIQNLWDKTIPQKIDYEEYKLLSPDFYQLDDEDEFLESVNMDIYFYKDVYAKKGNTPDGEWVPKMVSNHVCMLESQKRGLSMVQTAISKGDKYKFIMFIRPDMLLHNNFPIGLILDNPEKIHIPYCGPSEGINDHCAIMQYNVAHLYGNRIDELSDFRKNNGRIVGEKYCKFIISKYNMDVNIIDFKYYITRP